jgi:hypothetical protein
VMHVILSAKVKAIVSSHTHSSADFFCSTHNYLELTRILE